MTTALLVVHYREPPYPRITLSRQKKAPTLRGMRKALPFATVSPSLSLPAEGDRAGLCEQGMRKAALLSGHWWAAG